MRLGHHFLLQPLSVRTKWVFNGKMDAGLSRKFRRLSLPLMSLVTLVWLINCTDETPSNLGFPPQEQIPRLDELREGWQGWAEIQCLLSSTKGSESAKLGDLSPNFERRPGGNGKETQSITWHYEQIIEKWRGVGIAHLSVRGDYGRREIALDEGLMLDQSLERDEMYLRNC